MSTSSHQQQLLSCLHWSYFRRKQYMCSQVTIPVNWESIFQKLVSTARACLCMYTCVFYLIHMNTQYWSPDIVSWPYSIKKLKGKATVQGKQSLLQSKGLNVTVYKVHGSWLIDLVIMCIFWDQQLKAERKTQPALALVVYILLRHEADGSTTVRGKEQGQRC